jgi:hypothetical protein
LEKKKSTQFALYYFTGNQGICDVVTYIELADIGLGK